MTAVWRNFTGKRPTGSSISLHCYSLHTASSLRTQDTQHPQRHIDAAPHGKHPQWLAVPAAGQSKLGHGMEGSKGRDGVKVQSESTHHADAHKSIHGARRAGRAGFVDIPRVHSSRTLHFEAVQHSAGGRSVGSVSKALYLACPPESSGGAVLLLRCRISQVCV